MKVGELIKQLSNFDKEKEVVIRFALSNEDDIGYVLETITTGEYGNSVGIYSEYTATEEDCSFIGQKDLKSLWELGG